ncbi:hypothetical protein [Acrocarpospora pleiomorpha]|nr:hypothetical protein [Acrocarpospora pleiomorpha]
MMIRKLAAGLAAAGFAAVLLAPSPAVAAECTLGFCGTVKNNLPSYYTVKVARFGVGNETCWTYNAGSFTCQTYWLPSGKSSSDIGVKDADGFMLEQPFRHGILGQVLPAYTWVKIPSIATVWCNLLNGATTPTCYQCPPIRRERAQQPVAALLPQRADLSEARLGQRGHVGVEVE